MKLIRAPSARRAGLALVLYVVAPFAAGATDGLSSSSQLDDLLLLEVRLDQTVLSGAMPAHQLGSEVFLPLGELAQLLSIAVVSDPARGAASGFVISEDRGFYLDVEQGNVKLGETLESFDPSLIQVQDDDIYVARKLLARWLPADFDVDLSSLSLQVHPRETLPLQRRLERQNRSELGRGSSLPVDPGFPVQDSPYQWIEAPFIDQTLSTNILGDRDGSRLSTRSTTFVTGDVLGMQGAGFLKLSSADDTADYRFTLGRTDPDANLLGPLHARSFAFGSVPIQGVLNIAGTRAFGDGVSVSNYPLSRPLRFDTQSFSGPLPPSWDVELYYNDVLIGYQQSREDGTYNFDDLPLKYGRNDFRLVFLGPQGELREETQSLLVGESRSEPGALYYRVAAHADEADGLNSTAQFDWGLNRWLSLAGGLSGVSLAGKTSNYANFGLRASWESVFVTTDLALAPGGGTAAELGVRMRLNGITLTAAHTQLSNFASGVFQSSTDPLRMRDRVALDGALPFFAASRLPYTVTARRDLHRSGASNLQASLRVAALLRGATISNQLLWQSSGDDKALNGELQVARRFDRFGLRGLVGYRLLNDPRLTDVALSTDGRFAGGYVASLGLNRALMSRETRLTLGVNKTFGSLALGANVGYSSSGDFDAALRLFVSAGRDPRKREWMLDALPTAGGGGVSARVFVDENLNGTMDDDEQPVSGVGFTVNGGRQQVRTGEDGTAYIGRLPIKQHVDFGVDVNTLEDPQWIADPGGVRLVPRAGKVTLIDFPIVMTSEVDGTVRVASDDGGRLLSNVTVELVDANGDVVASGTSAFDGFYIIEAVRPGDYHIRVSEEDMQRLGLTDADPSPRAVIVSPDGEYVSGIDLELAPPSSTAPAAPRAGDVPPDGEFASATELGSVSPAPDAPSAARAVSVIPKNELVSAADLNSLPPPAASQGAHPNTLWMIQLGAFSTRARARTQWRDTSSAHQDLVAGFEPAIIKAKLGTKGTLHRLRIGPLAPADARRLCGALAARATNCLVIP